MAKWRFVLGLCLVGQAGAALKPFDAEVPPSGKTTVVYKIAPEGELKMDLYFPRGWMPGDHRPAIVFFFGGGFTNGTTGQFTHAAEYLASRGMVAASADYRVRNRQKTGPEKSIEDAKSAVRWLRVNARGLGIDGNRVAAGGGSAGATCAAFAAYNTAYEPDGEDATISERPNALVLFNPAMGYPDDPAGLKPGQTPVAAAFLLNWTVTKNGPPAVVFYGTEDTLGEKGRMFVEKMLAAGNRAELYTAAGQKHGFFNPARPAEKDKPQGSPGWHEATLFQMDLFLESLGYLTGKPAIAVTPGVSLKRELP